MKNGMRKLAVLTLLVGLVASTGCAARNVGPTTGADTVTLQVEGVPTVGSLTIYVVPETGARRMIGHVSSGQEAVLTFDINGSGSYRFMAETLSQQGAVSNALFFAPGATVQWNLTSNIATVSG